jgi:CRISPR-associated endonuclease/helicase Cas3
MIEKFLAKSTGLTLVEHTQHVMTAVENLIQKLYFEEKERAFWLDKIVRCAILHDIGKIHELFQENLRESQPKNAIRHEIMSLWLIEQFLELPQDECFAIATHHKGVIADGHGRLDTIILADGMPDLISQFYDFEILKQFMEDWKKAFKLKTQSLNLVTTTPKLSKNSTQLLNQRFQRRIEPDAKKRFHLAKTRGLLIASDHIGSARLENEIPDWKRLEIQMFQPKNDKTGEVYPFRTFQKKLQTVKNDVILYAPTGSGKTEAALAWYFANQEENGRLFYLLPYTASINAMVKRMQIIFGDEVVTALHSKTLEFFFEQLENEDDNHFENAQKARTLKSFSKELFFPVKVATPHQVLKNALMGKGWEISLFDYQKACFIVDEFHTYDALMTGLMLATIKWLKDNFEAKIFFMSATIPKFLCDLIIDKIYDGNANIFIQPNPKEPSDKVVLGQKRHQLICCKDKCITDEIDLIKSYLNNGKSVLVIVNNVKTCQDLYEEINFTKDVKLLHSGFNKRDRILIEKLITDKYSKPQLLIATQAVEVSLDIDYDVAFIENAPIDALIQRFGRVNRAGKQESTAPVYIFENIIGNTKFFYDEEFLKLTFENLLKLNKQDLSESDLVNVCNQVYKNGYNETQKNEFDKGFNNSMINNFKDELIAGHWRSWIEDVIEGQSLKIDVLCQNLLDDYEKLKEKGDFIKANQLLVSVYRYETKEMYIKNKEARAKYQVIVASDLEYSSRLGYLKRIDNVDDRIF